MYFIIMDKRQTCFVLLTLSSILIIAISGCTFPGGGTTTGQGIVIENFEVDFPRIFAGEKFKIQMLMRNQGSVDADNVYPKLYNIGSNFQGSDLEISCQETCGQGVYLLAHGARKRHRGGDGV